MSRIDVWSIWLDKALLRGTSGRPFPIHATQARSLHTLPFIIFVHNILGMNEIDPLVPERRDHVLFQLMLKLRKEHSK